MKGQSLRSRWSFKTLRTLTPWRNNYGLWPKCFAVCSRPVTSRRSSWVFFDKLLVGVWRDMNGLSSKPRFVIWSNSTLPNFWKIKRRTRYSITFGVHKQPYQINLQLANTHSWPSVDFKAPSLASRSATSFPKIPWWPRTWFWKRNQDWAHRTKLVSETLPIQLRFLPRLSTRFQILRDSRQDRFHHANYFLAIWKSSWSYLRKKHFCHSETESNVTDWC